MTLRTTPDRAAQLERAYAYPYDRPLGSFLFRPGHGAAAWDEDRSRVAGRHALVSIGSNASPTQLERKLAGRTSPHGIPVLAATLTGYDAVYAARVSAYGAVPASITPAPGVTVAAHIVFLDDEELDVLHRSEGLHRRDPQYRAIGIPASAVGCPVPVEGPLLAYQASSGHLAVNGGLVAVAAFPATGRSYPVMSEREVLDHVAGLFGCPTDEFVLAVATSADTHHAVKTRLGADHALPAP